MQSLKLFIASVLIAICFTGCNNIPNDPIKGAENYVAEMKSAIENDNLAKVDEITAKYLNAYEDTKRTTFCLALKPLLQDPTNDIVYQFFGTVDSKTYPHVIDLMRWFLATEGAQKQVEASKSNPAEDAINFCMALLECSETKDFNRASTLINNAYSKYSKVSDADKTIFFTTFQRFIKENGQVGVSVFEFMQSDELQNSNFTNFKRLALESLPE